LSPFQLLLLYGRPLYRPYRFLFYTIGHLGAMS